MDPERYQKLLKEVELELLQRKEFLQSEVQRLSLELELIVEDSKEVFRTFDEGSTRLPDDFGEIWYKDYDYYLDMYMWSRAYIWRSEFTPEEEKQLNVIFLMDVTMSGIFHAAVQVITMRVLMCGLLFGLLHLIMNPHKIKLIWHAYLRYRTRRKRNREYERVETYGWY
jgi:hypothetical protein